MICSVGVPGGVKEGEQNGSPETLGTEAAAVEDCRIMINDKGFVDVYLVKESIGKGILLPELLSGENAACPSLAIIQVNQKQSKQLCIYVEPILSKYHIPH